MATKEQLWEEGDYEASPKSVVYAESGVNKTPHMIVTFDVGGHAKTAKLWLSPKARSRTLMLLKALGFNGKFYDNPQVDASLKVQLALKHAEYPVGSGQWKEEWTYWGPQATIERGAAATLEAEYRSMAPASSSPPAGKPTPAAAAAAPSRPSAAETKPAATAPRPSVKADKPADEKPIASNANEAWAIWLTKAQADTRDEKWGEILKQFGDKTGDESKVTPEEWNKIALAADIPF